MTIEITYAQITDKNHIRVNISAPSNSTLQTIVTDNDDNTVIVSKVDWVDETTYILVLGTELTDFSRTYYVQIGSSLKTAYFAPALIDNQYDYSGQLGAIYSKSSTTFKLWAPVALAVNLLIYNLAIDDAPAAIYPMTKENNGVWNYTLSGDADGFIYQYEVTNGQNVWKVLDPYARSMVAFDSESAIDKVGKAVVINLNSESATTLTDPTDGTGKTLYDWGKDSYYYLQNQTEAIIYEISVRDFTIDQNDTTGTIVPSTLKGTYLGLIYKIPYLKKLGITHVQLLPVLKWNCGKEVHKDFENFDTSSGYTKYPLNHGNSYGNSYYNWGYDPLNYFTPEGWYATHPADPYSRIKELRTLITAFHASGIGVILDVVYNHTYTMDTFENIVPNYYYRRDSKGRPTRFSGCNNDCATERLMFRKLILDSTAYWLQEFHVDGFRFDLAGCFDKETGKAITRSCRSINPYVELHGELWDMGGLTDITDRYVKGDPSGKTSYRVLLEDQEGISGFSDGFRDGMIQHYYGSPITEGGFIQAHTFDPYNEKRVRTGIVANLSNYISTPGAPLIEEYYHLFCDEPAESLNYVNCHDGPTIWDKICNSTASYTRAQRLRVNKLQAAIVLTSQGKVFLHGGEEILRSKPNELFPGGFDSNSYDSPDSVNQIIWSNSSSIEGQDMLDYYRGLIALRKAHPAFTMESASLIQNSLTFIDGAPNFMIAYRIQRTDGKETWPEIVVIHNANSFPQALTIPGVNLTNWVVVVDGSIVNLDGLTSAEGVIPGNESITVPPISTVVIHAPGS